MKRSRQGHNAKISEFKVHLGKYLKEVKLGQEVTVFDRETPVAKLVPYLAEQENQVEVISPSRTWKEVSDKWLAKSSASEATPLKKSSLAYLQDDRDSK